MSDTRAVARRAGELLGLAVRLAGLAPGVRHRATTFLRVLLVPVVRRLPYVGRRGVRLRLDMGGAVQTIHVADRCELNVLQDVLLDGQYATALPHDPHTVVDLGANIGVTALWLRGLFPRARILAVEPDPETCARLRRNVAGYAIEVREAAVCDVDGEITLHSARASWGSSVSMRQPGTKEVTVQAVTLGRLLDEHALERVDLLKFDVEGAEYAMFEAFRGEQRIERLVGELHGSVDRGVERLRAALGGWRLEVVHRGRDALVHGTPPPVVADPRGTGSGRCDER